MTWREYEVVGKPAVMAAGVGRVRGGAGAGSGLIVQSSGGQL